MGNNMNDPFSNIVRDGVNMKANQYDQKYQQHQQHQQQHQQQQQNNSTIVDDILNQIGGQQGRNYDSPSDTDHSVKHFSTNRKKRQSKNNRQRGINIDV